MSPPHDDPNKMRLLAPHSSFPCEPPISILKSKSSSTARSRSSSGTWSPPTHKSWDAKPLRYARKVSFEGDAAAWPGMPSRSPVTPDHTAGFYYPSSSSSSAATSRGTQGQDAWVTAAHPPVPVWRLLEQHPPVGTTTGTTKLCFGNSDNTYFFHTMVRILSSSSTRTTRRSKRGRCVGANSLFNNQGSASHGYTHGYHPRLVCSGHRSGCG